MEAPVEIRYAGVVLGRAQEVRQVEGQAATFFIVGRDPMPVGTVVYVHSGEKRTPARVVRAVESTDATVSGMQVRLLEESEEFARDWIPTKAEPKAIPVPTPQAFEAVSAGAGDSNAGPASERGTPAQTPLSDPPAREGGEVAQELAAVTSDTARTETDLLVAEARGVSKGASAAEREAVPEAIPVATGSSMSGVLMNVVQTPEPSETSIPSIIIADADGTSTATDTSMATTSESAAIDDLPPARPVSGPTGRRRTKRRK